MKKIVSSKVPNLGRLEDMADLLTKGGVVSDSEAEEDEASKVDLPQEMSVRGVLPAQQSSVRLVELGPRIRYNYCVEKKVNKSGAYIFHFVKI